MFKRTIRESTRYLEPNARNSIKSKNALLSDVAFKCSCKIAISDDEKAEWSHSSVDD